MYRRYASKTSVSVERSIGEIQKTLNRHGCAEFMSGTKDDKSIIQFQMNERRIRFVLPLPPKADYSTNKRGREKPVDKILKDWEQACRQRFRALALAVKAKLEAVEAGITTFEEEFMAHIVLPSGHTVGAWMSPQIEQAYQSKKMPPMLPGAVEKG